MTRDSAYLRAELARNAGLFLDEPDSDRDVKPPNTPEPSLEVDRAEVRRILVAAGAPAADLEWLVASCVSVEAARGYRAPPSYAWCVDCGTSMPIDEHGCIACGGGR